MAEKIAAVATGHARTGIGILRLSGDGCIEAAGQVFHLQSGKPLSSLPNRKLALGTLFDVQGRPIDHCMAFISRAPHSYTGEDTAEIQCHGSPAALAAGLDESDAAALTGLLDRWAVWISAKPGAGIYFDTAYAAIVCLVLILLCWLAFHWRVRLRVAGPCILLAAAVSIGLGNALSRDVVHIDLVGSANAPAVVVTQNDTAMVLFRGGASAQNAVENQLARRGVQTVELVADLRTNPKTACTLEAERTLPAAEMAVNTAQKLRCTPALVEMLRTRNGCLVRLTVGNRQFAVVNGTVELAKQVTVQWLLASPAKPDTVQYKNVLALRSYDWMDNRKELAASISLRRHGGLKTE